MWFTINICIFSGLRKIAFELEKINLTLNSHHFGLSHAIFEYEKDMKNFRTVISFSLMPSRTAFLAFIEAKDYLIFGI